MHISVKQQDGAGDDSVSNKQNKELMLISSIIDGTVNGLSQPVCQGVLAVWHDHQEGEMIMVGKAKKRRVGCPLILATASMRLFLITE